jgi:hypothetical protein
VTGAVLPPPLLVTPGAVLLLLGVSETAGEELETGPEMGTVSVTPLVLVMVILVVSSSVGLRLVLPVPEDGLDDEIGRLLAVSEMVLLPVGVLDPPGALVLLPYVGTAELETIGVGVSVAGADVSLPVTGVLEFAYGTLGEIEVVTGKLDESEEPSVGRVLAAVVLKKGAELAKVGAVLISGAEELGDRGAVDEPPVGSVEPPNVGVKMGLVSVSVGGGPLVDGDSDDPSVVGKDSSSVQVVSGTTVPEGVTPPVPAGPVVVAYVKLGTYEPVLLEPTPPVPVVPMVPIVPGIVPLPDVVSGLDDEVGLSLPVGPKVGVPLSVGPAVGTLLGGGGRPARGVDEVDEEEPKGPVGAGPEDSAGEVVPPVPVVSELLPVVAVFGNVLEIVPVGPPMLEFVKEGYRVFDGDGETPLPPAVGTELAADDGPVGINEPGVDVTGPVGTPVVSEPELGPVTGREEAKEELEYGTELPEVGTKDEGAVPDVTGAVVGIPPVTEPDVGPVTGADGKEELDELLKLDGTDGPVVGSNDEGTVPEVTGPVVEMPPVIDPDGEPEVGPVIEELK